MKTFIRFLNRENDLLCDATMLTVPRIGELVTFMEPDHSRFSGKAQELRDKHVRWVVIDVNYRVQVDDEFSPHRVEVYLQPLGHGG